VKGLFKHFSDEKEEITLFPYELLIIWISFAIPGFLAFGLVIYLYSTAYFVPVRFQKQLMELKSDGTYHYYYKLMYPTPSGMYQVNRLATIFYTNIEKETKLTAIYHPWWPSFGMLDGVRGFWIPAFIFIVFFSLFTGGIIYLNRILFSKQD